MADFKEVLRSELDEIRELRRRRGLPDGEVGAALTGLCFSGGGIRSATFCLGVLQGLATYRLLRRFDYISTVSGGGYIAAWLVSWIKRPGKAGRRCSGIGIVEASLRRSPPHLQARGIQTRGTPRRKKRYVEAGAINFLRAYSNYLTPRRGMFGADTWVAVVSYVRNLLLNQAILVASLAAAILVPRFLQLGFQSALRTQWGGNGWLTGGIAVLLLLFALVFFDRNIADFSLREAVAENLEGKKPAERYLARSSQSRVLLQGVLPLFAAAVLGALSLAQFVKADAAIAEAGLLWWTGVGAVGYLLSRGVTQAVLRVMLIKQWQTRKQAAGSSAGAQAQAEARARTEALTRDWKASRTMLLWAPVAGALGGVLVRELVHVFHSWVQGENPAGVAHLVSWGPPLLVAITLLTGVLHVGLMGLMFPNQKKEWWARLAAWLLIWTLAWVSLFAIALFAPLGVLKLGGWVKTKTTLILSWAGTTLYGVLAGRSSATSGEKSGNPALELAATIAPYVFIVGTLVLISYGVHAVLDTSSTSGMMSSAEQVEMQGSGKLELQGGAAAPYEGTFKVSFSHERPAKSFSSYEYWRGWERASTRLLVGFFVILVVTALVLAWRVDINEFSFHLFYRNRLVRCYLGATNPERCPHPFTGFDPSDDILLRDFSTQADRKYSGPYPVLNAALNITHGQRLAWQERRAESFVLTPKFCGFDFQEERKEPEEDQDQKPGSKSGRQKDKAEKDAYRDTSGYGYATGPYLGTAVAISGAAVNPNMGYHASAPVAFLLTLFNVRLGWWMGNPRRATWRRSTPHIGLFYLLGELFGMTDDTSRYVNLSDGWHFENLGLYELVRRQCKYIVACDVGADASFGREDLGNAVRKCRSDFGVEIDIDADQLRPGKNGFSEFHYVIGNIRYPNGSQGRLLYIKSALTGEEPQDILAYKVANPAFPHQGTGDQWFEESQFESYRALGRFAVESALSRLGDPESVSLRTTEDIFNSLS